MFIKIIFLKFRYFPSSILFVRQCIYRFILYFSTIVGNAVMYFVPVVLHGIRRCLAIIPVDRYQCVSDATETSSPTPPNTCPLANSRGLGLINVDDMLQHIYCYSAQYMLYILGTNLKLSLLTMSWFAYKYFVIK